MSESLYIIALCSFKIKSKRVHVWSQDKTDSNPTSNKPSTSVCTYRKIVRFFCLVGFSFFFYAPEKLIPVLIKSKSICNCGLSKFLRYRQLITGDADKELLL